MMNKYFEYRKNIIEDIAFDYAFALKIAGKLS